MYKIFVASLLGLSVGAWADAAPHCSYLGKTKPGHDSRE